MRLSLLTVALWIATPFAHAEQTLTFFTWEEYLSEEVVSEWEKRTGAKLKQVYFDNDEDRDRIMTDPDTRGIDIALFDGLSSRVFAGSNILAPVTEVQIPNIKHIDPKHRESCGQEKSVPYLWGTIGIAYRTDKVDPPPSSWRDLMQPREALHGHISLFEDFTDTLVPPLMLMGQNINTSDPAQLKAAFDMLKSVIPAVLTFEYPITFISQTDQPQALFMGMAYSGDQWAMNEAAGAEIWDYVIPDEGTVIWTDCIGVVASSPNKKLAYDFINYLNEPTVAARNAEAVYVAPTNEPAIPLLSNAMRSDMTVFPDQALLEKSQQYAPLDEANLSLRNRITSALVKMHETQ